MWGRLGTWLWTILIAVDHLLQTIIWGAIYVVRGGECPESHETISSQVGRLAHAGHRGGLIAQRAIDSLFARFGQTDHCMNAFLSRPVTPVFDKDTGLWYIPGEGDTHDEEEESG